MGIRLLTSLVAALAVSLVGAASAAATFRGQNGRLAYGIWARPVAVKYVIWSIRADGTGNRRLQLSPEAANPAFSPDGSELAYDGRRGIWTARTAGVDAPALRIPLLGEWDGVEQPTFAPNGRTIAFTAHWLTYREEGPEHEIEEIAHDVIYAADAHGEPRRLQPGFEPVYSPNGRWIAYISRGYNAIKIMRSDGSHPRTLAHGLNLPGSLDFSPDGRRLVFRERHESAEGFANKLRIIDIRRRTLTTLPVPGDPLAVTWSPDGTRLAYLWEHSWRPGEGAPATQIWTMRTDGSDQHHVYTLRHHAWAKTIAWQPRPAP